jgi:hypothetical protein
LSKALEKQFEFDIPSEEENIPEMSYDTDLITLYPEMFPYNGATQSSSNGSVTANAQNEGVCCHFFISDKIDPGRKMMFDFDYICDGSGATYDMDKYLKRIPCDGTTDTFTTIWNWTDETFNNANANFFHHDHIELESSDIYADNHYVFYVRLEDAGETIIFTEIAVRYHQKREHD